MLTDLVSFAPMPCDFKVDRVQGKPVEPLGPPSHWIAASALAFLADFLRRILDTHVFPRDELQKLRRQHQRLT